MTGDKTKPEELRITVALVGRKVGEWLLSMAILIPVVWAITEFPLLKLLAGLVGVVFGTLALYWISVFWITLWRGIYVLLSELPLLACVVALIGIGLLGWQTFALCLLGLVLSVVFCTSVVAIGTWL